MGLCRHTLMERKPESQFRRTLDGSGKDHATLNACLWRLGMTLFFFPKGSFFSFAVSAFGEGGVRILTF